MLRQARPTTTIVFAGLIVAAAAGSVSARNAGGTPASASAEARRPAAALPLTLGDAIDEALANNPELNALRREFEAARERPAQERFLRAPTLEAQIWQWPLASLNPADTNMYMFMAGQDIPGPGKRRLREAVVQTDVRRADADIAVRARDVVARVKQAYAELSHARKAVEVHHASVDLLRRLADAAQAKYSTGRISQQDVLKAVVELSRIHDHLISLDEEAQLAEARLNTLLDRPAGGPIGPLAAPRERLLLPSAGRLEQLALDHQPELALARLGVERADAQLAVVSREYKPDFFVQGGYMLMPGEGDAWMARLGITWPKAPWSRGRLDAQRAEVTAQIAAARARVRGVENALRLSVRQAYVRAQAAGQRAALLRTTVVPQAEQTLEVSRAAYQTDTGNFLAILDSERVRLDAELAYYRALSDREQAIADLERAVGTDIAAAAAAAAGLQGGR